MWPSDEEDVPILPEDDVPAALSGAPPWTVMVVDDDEQVHAITRLILRDVTYLGREIRLVSAMSAAEARLRLDELGASVALALVDVVMETEQSGLELVSHIRHTLNNRTMRLILRTGHPGYAPEADVIVNYEIDDYKSKTELTAQKLVTAVIASLRAFSYINEIATLSVNLEATVSMRTAALEKLAMLDPLTGAGNRRHLARRVDIECAALRRHGGALALVAFDIDHFKQVNDRYGHAAGDRALCHTVQTIRQAMRAGDFLARVGGEEFVVLLPGQDLPSAAAVAERMRAALAAAPVALDSQWLPLTASFGVAMLDPEAGFEAALARADAALYGAKREGRNRVVLSDGAH